MSFSGGWQLVTEVDDQNPVLGDLRVSGGRLARVESFGDQVAQSVRVRLRWWRAEWFLDQSQGTPYLEQLLGKGITEDTVRTVLKREIKAVPGVARVESMTVEIDRATRRCSVFDLVIVTTEGESVAIGEVL